MLPEVSKTVSLLGPSAAFFGYFIPSEWAVDYLIPWDFLFSVSVIYLIFGIIYPVVVVRTGMTSYQPGVERTNDYFGWNNGPFRFNAFISWGMVIGLGLWLIYSNRSHFMGILRSIYSGAKESETFGTPGISYRSLGIWTLILTLLNIIFLVGSNVPPFVAVMILVVQTLFFYGWTRYIGDIFEFWGVHEWFRWFYYDAGAISGAWPATPPAPVTQGSFSTSMLSNTAIQRTSVMGNISNLFNVFKLGAAHNTSPWDVLKVATIATIIIAIIITPFTVWWYTIMGGRLNLGPVARDAWMAGVEYAFLGGTPAPPIPDPLERYGLLFGGIIFVFILYALRARFPWFILAPTAFVAMPVCSWGHIWIDFMAVCVIKYVVLRIGGSRLYERTVPFAVGVLIGYGVCYALTSFVAWVLIAIPEAFTRLAA